MMMDGCEGLGQTRLESRLRCVLMDHTCYFRKYWNGSEDELKWQRGERTSGGTGQTRDLELVARSGQRRQGAY
jgi:hypothetical protein